MAWFFLEDTDSADLFQAPRKLSGAASATLGSSFGDLLQPHGRKRVFSEAKMLQEIHILPFRKCTRTAHPHVLSWERERSKVFKVRAALCSV